MIMQTIIRIKIYLLFIFSVFFISAVNFIGGYFYFKGPLKEDKVVIIENGQTTRQIAQQLYKEGVINNQILFELAAIITSYKDFLKSGEYQFTIGITPYQVLQKLIKGKSIIHQLFIPEGLMVSEILQILNDETRLTGPITENIKEGYLMPSTYHFSYGDKRSKIINIMKREMTEAIDSAMRSLKPNSPIKSRADILILASIIEKEAGNDQERNMISAVFINRLNKNIKLQADPTVIYGVTKGQYKLQRQLSRADLMALNNYNTYKIYGLPSGAICCPGVKSIMAAVNPAKSDALYFVTNGLGGHAFSKTLAEHNKHVKKLRTRQKKIRRKKALTNS